MDCADSRQNVFQKTGLLTHANSSTWALLLSLTILFFFSSLCCFTYRLFQELIEVLEYRDKLENELDSRRRLIAILRAVSEKDNVAPHSNSQGGLLNGMRATATAAFAPSSSAGVSRVVVPYRSGVTLAQPQACESLVQILMAMRAQKEEDFRSRLMDYMDTVL